MNEIKMLNFVAKVIMVIKSALSLLRALFYRNMRSRCISGNYDVEHIFALCIVSTYSTNQVYIQ